MVMCRTVQRENEIIDDKKNSIKILREEINR